MKRLVLFLVLVMSFASTAGAETIYDGNWWVEQTSGIKLGYIMGYADGATTAFTNMMSVIKDRELLIPPGESDRVLDILSGDDKYAQAIRDLKDSSDIYDFPFKVGVYEVELDAYYLDPANLSTPVWAAFLLVNLELKAK